MGVVKRSDRQLIGPVAGIAGIPGIPGIPGVPALTLTLSVLLCIGAMADGPAAAAVLARSLQRQGATADQRESMASLLSSLNDAARKLCRHQSGQAIVAMQPNTDHLFRDVTTALRPYDSPGRCDVMIAMQPQLLNLPPPVASI